MITAGIYLRISKDHSGEGLGVARQGEDCQTLLERRGWPLYGQYSDNDRSATKRTVKRDEFERLLKDIEAGHVHVVVAWNLDRLLRNDWDRYRFYSLCKEKGILLALVRGGELDMSTAMGRAIAGFMADIAKLEVEAKGERQQSRNLQAARAGKPHVTHRPFGYEKDCVTIRPDEAEVLNLMAKLVIAGNSYMETAWQLNERGFRTSRGNKLHGVTVRRLCQNKRYAAIREYRGVDYKAQWPAIFDDEIWQQLQLTVRLRKDLAGGHSPARKFLLTGLLYCGKCGTMMTGVTERHSRTGKVHRAYRCYRMGRTERTGGCGKVYRNADHLEGYLRELVLYRLDSPALAKLLASSRGQENGLKRLLTERQGQQQRLDGLIDDYSTGLLTRTELARAKVSAQVELDRIEKEIGRLTARSAPIDIPLSQTLEQAWDGHRDEWRRRLLNLVIERVVVKTGNNNVTRRLPGGSYVRFNPDLIDVLWRD